MGREVTRSKVRVWRGEATMRGPGSGRKKMTIGVTFELLKIVASKEARNQNGVPQARRTRKKTY